MSTQNNRNFIDSSLIINKSRCMVNGMECRLMLPNDNNQGMKWSYRTVLLTFDLDNSRYQNQSSINTSIHYPPSSSSSTFLSTSLPSSTSFSASFSTSSSTSTSSREWKEEVDSSSASSSSTSPIWYH